MNAYLSREEKQNFVRATALVSLIEETIDGYALAKSADPGFLKYLRMGRSMLSKALTLRGDALDPGAKEEFAKQVGKLEFICVPRPEAKKAHAEMMALKSVLPMKVQDFEDWYCAVIEATCKKCAQENYTDCTIRRILNDYSVYPIDPEAKNKCQYGYVGTPEAEELQPAVAETVPAETYNQAEAEFAALNIKAASLEEQLSEYDRQKLELVEILYFEDDRPENPSIADLIDCVRQTCKDFEIQDREQMEEIRELRGQVGLLQGYLAAAESRIDDLEKQATEYAEAAAVPEIDLPASENGQLAVSLGMSNGNCLVYDLPEYMTRVLIKELHQASRRKRGICASHVDGDLIAVDMSEVVVMRVANAPADMWTSTQHQEAPQQSQPEEAPAEVPADTGERERYRVECKCGVEYFCSMNTGRTKARCRECNSTVFADRLVSPIPDPVDNVEATLLTNRYWVEKESYSDARPATPVDTKYDERKDIRKNYGRDYKDPCDPLAG